MATARLKESFAVKSKHGAFYTGGNVEWHDGHFYTQTTAYVAKVDVDTGNVVLEIGKEPDGEVDTIHTFTADAKHVVTSHKSGLLKLWNTTSSPTAELEKSWKYIHKGPIASLKLDGDRLLSGGSDGVVREWDLTHHVCLRALKGCQGVVSLVDYGLSVVFASGDDGRVISWGVDGTVVYEGHFSKVTSIGFHHDLRHFVTAGRDKVLILWELGNSKALKTVPVYEGVESIVVLPPKFKLPSFKSDPGIYVALGGENGIVQVWNVETSNRIYTQTNSLVTKAKDDGGLSIVKLILSEDKKTLAIISAEHNIILHRLKSFAVTKQLIGFSDEILDIVIAGSNDSYIVVATNSCDIKFYETATMNCQILKGHTDIVLGLNKAPFNPNLIVSASKDKTIRLWEINDGMVNCVALGMRHTETVGTACFAYVSKFIVTVSQDTCLKLWDLPEKFPESITNLTCRLTEVAHHKDINSVAVSLNDKIIATGSQDKTAKLWSDNLTLLGTLKGHRRGVWCVRFSPIDQVLLTSSADCTIKLWSISDLNCLKTFEGHESSVMRADFISNGMQVISAGGDGFIKLFNIKTSECVLTLDEHEDKIWSFALTKNEQTLISAGADSTLIIYEDNSEEIRQQKREALETVTIEEQKLSNYIQNDELLKALKLSIKLDKPHHTLKIVQNIIKKGATGLPEAISKLRDDHKETLLKFATDWNTNSRNCQPAQLVLNILIGEMQSGAFRPVGLASIVEASLPYTERHFKRVTQMMQDLHFITYTINCMQPHAK